MEKDMFGIKTATRPEVASFPFIEEMLEKALSKKVEPTEAQRSEAKSKSKAVVAGFPVFDPAKEKEELDKLCSVRQKSIEAFIADRKAVREKLKALGITPLAVVPAKAWVRLCGDAGLIIFKPDAKGRVGINRDAVRRYGSVKKMEAAAATDHAKYVSTLMTADRDRNGNESCDWRVVPTVILPTPPQDVVDTLLKAKEIALKTAAVPEAIRFAQTPKEIWDATAIDPRDLWARQQGYADYADWVKRDPIVYHEHGTAAAIIAQFGDFPIEKKVVEIVMGSNDMIPENAGAALVAGAAYAGSGVGVSGILGTLARQYSSAQINDDIQRQMYEYQRQQADMMRQYGGGYREGTSTGMILSTTSNG